MTAPRPIRSLLAVSAAMLALAGCSAPAVPVVDPVEQAADAPLVPEQGALLGIYYGDGEPAATDAAIGRTPPLHLTYFGWEDDWVGSDAVTQDAEAGRISLVNWEPFGVDFADILAGEYDDMLLQRATTTAALEQPVMLDFAAEMNEEEGWGGHDPELYVAAYQHVHDVFEGADGGNVVWVWAPNNTDSAGAPPALDYYPGEQYVDWTGIDGYNWGTDQPGFGWQSFEQVFRDMVDELTALGKPIIIGETASSETGGDKADWIAGIVPTLRDEFPLIRAVVWFDIAKERDWRIRSSPEALRAFQEFAADPYFG